MITMMFGGPPSGFDPASSESDSAEATVAFAIMAAVISKREYNRIFMSVNFDRFYSDDCIASQIDFQLGFDLPCFFGGRALPVNIFT